MQLLLKYPYRWLSMLLLLFVVTSSSAQKVAVISKVLDGAQNQLVKDAAINVYDSVFLKYADSGWLSASYAVKNIITFHINEYSDQLLPDSFTATANIRIIYLRPDNQTDSIEQTLKLNYADSAAYTSRSTFVFNNSHDVTVRVLAVSISNDSATVRKVLMLENEMDIQAVYNMSCTSDTVSSIAYVPVANTDTTDELTVNWPEVTGADEYDLEWTFVDDSALVDNRYGNPLNAVLLFRNNSSRVTVKSGTYNIPLFFDGPGKVFFRVRAVQSKSNNARLETAWTPANPSAGSYAFTGHQRALNWQANIAFAEEGKRNVTVDYFDGTLRNRQTVTKDNTTNTTIVGETFYDYQGRGVIQVMPAPTLNTVIKYSRNFNQSITGEYDKSNYDYLEKPADFLTASAAQMSSNSGANQYYSPNNPKKDEGINRFIPDANGYAFTETSYTQDGTGRISRQGGVGEVFRLGSNHETKYYYASPGDNDLDVLFGTEAGDKTHYFKNTIQDANGQMSVSYVDMHGRTVATALAGRPDSAQLDDLESNQNYVVIDTLSRPGTNTVNGLVLESSHTQLVTIDTTYKFHYAVMPPVLKKKICDKDSTICFNALYDLEILITDDVYNQHIRNGLGFDTIITNYTAKNICNPDSLKFDFELDLKKGSYQITKRLTINAAGLAYYRDSIFMKYQSCQTLAEFIQTQRDLLAGIPCVPDCQSCRDSVGTWDYFRSKYMTKLGVAAADTASLRGEALSAYGNAVEACAELCDTLSPIEKMRKALLEDVSAPSGQYATVDDSSYIYSIFYHKGTSDAAPYARDTVTYLNEAGTVDSLYNDQTGKYVLPNTLTPVEFAKNFKSSWAAALLKFHPEYCRFVAYQKFDSSLIWDEKVDAVSSYTEARDQGYLNPFDTTASAFPQVTANKDPLAGNTAVKNKLYSRLNNYNYRSGDEALSMYSVAAILIKCPETTTECASNYNTPSSAFNENMCSGDLDAIWRTYRTLYINYKKHLVDSLVQAASCPNSPTAAKLTSDGKSVHFPKESDAYDMADINYVNGNTDAASDSVQAAMKASYEANCNSYTTYWLSQLLQCAHYDEQTITDSILPKLKQVCLEGADSTHILGSSTTKPGSTYEYSSFEDVINDYNVKNGINIKLTSAADTMNCNGLVLTIPAPYDKQRSFSDIETYVKPSECQCEKLHDLQTEYNALKKTTDTTLATYLNRTRSSTLTDEQVNLLLESCDASKSDCGYMSSILTIPPFMQCDVAPACITCMYMDTLYTNFTASYPGITPTVEEPDTLQRNKNVFFANYMNNATGYSLEAWQYLSFMNDSCKNNPPGMVEVCDDANAVNSIHSFSNGNATAFNDLIATSDGGFLLAGYITVTGRNKEAYLVKTDSTGAVVWAKGYGNTNEDYFQRVRATSDGGYIAIGTTYYSKLSNLFIVKTNSQGVITWKKVMPITGGSTGTDILETADGGYVFAARRALTRPVMGEVGAINSSGERIWLQHFKSPTGKDMEGFSLALSGDTLVVAGCFLDGILGNTVFNMFVNKLNRNTGDTISSHAYAKQTTTSEGNYSKHLFKTSYGYLLNFTATNSSTDRNIVMGIDHIGGVSFAKEFGNFFSGINPTQWAPVTVTSDGGLMTIQNFETSPQKIMWGQLDANYQMKQSELMLTNEATDVQMIAQAGNGRYVAVGSLGSKAMLMLTQPSGLMACSDSLVNNTVSDVQINKTRVNWNNNSNDINNFYFYEDATFIETDLSNSTTHIIEGCTYKTCYSLYNGPLLCGNATAVYPSGMDTITNCTDDDFYAISVGTEQYKGYRDSLLTSFRSEYLDSALAGGQRELFTVVYTNSEYHYTLFYYDQAGNLVKTVPPAGGVVDRSDAWVGAVRQARKAGVEMTPAHTMATENRYNTLNQIVAQISPDGGLTRFWYDRLGRQAISQNTKQAKEDKYSYTAYDALGRITEVGELTSASPMTEFISRDTLQYANWLNAASSSRAQITKTVYDVAYDASDTVLTQQNLRNRVSWIGLFDNAASLSTASGLDYSSGTFYSYDIHGNVKSLMQDYKNGKMNVNGNRMKTISYQYDLISGKVNWVGYQAGSKDAFYHRYTYDAINRLTDVETSRDSVYWEKDAYYQYYQHGPLARTVIGQQQVQGVDYAYTLQGQLKGINSTALTPAFDMGADGSSTSQVAKDALGLGLHFFGNRDYTAISNAVTPFAAGVNIKPLFTGNISAISQNIPSVGISLLYNYSYDVLNRLKEMTAARGMDSLTNTWSKSFTTLDAFHEKVSYDANGNILKYSRNGNNTIANTPLAMDNLVYHYRPGTNRLDYVMDSVPSSNYGNDIDSQYVGNYRYDSIGNITFDRQAGIDSIKWNLYGKVSSIYKSDGKVIKYTYDVDGNRNSKTVDSLVTWYVRDATGNVISVYTVGDSVINSGQLSQTEAHLYGSSRLGMLKLSTNMGTTEASTETTISGIGAGINTNFTRGNKLFELSNHLGNVLATVSDKKVGISTDNSTIDHYEPLIISSQEYYPFGMLMPGRGSNLVLGQYGDGSGVASLYKDSLIVSERVNNTPSEYVATKIIRFLPGFSSAVGDNFKAYISSGDTSGAGSGSGSVGTGGYRYGFNGQERSDEIAGAGNHTTAEFWEYDTRIGRRWNLDPESTIGISAYSGLYNNPILFCDLLGNKADPPGWWSDALKNFNWNNTYMGRLWGSGASEFNHTVTTIENYHLPTKEQYWKGVRENFSNMKGAFWGGIAAYDRALSLGFYKVPASNFHFTPGQATAYNLTSDIVSSVASFTLPTPGGSAPSMAVATNGVTATIGVKLEAKINAYVFANSSQNNSDNSNVEGTHSRINLPPGRTRFTPMKPSTGNPTKAGLDHVYDGHFEVELANSRSVFSITKDKLKEILQRKSTVSSPVTPIPGGQFRRVVDIGEPIGHTALKFGGEETSWIEIFTDIRGNLISTYPVPAPQP